MEARFRTNGLGGSVIMDVDLFLFCFRFWYSFRFLVLHILV